MIEGLCFDPVWFIVSRRGTLLISLRCRCVRSPQTVQISVWRVKTLHQTPSMQPGCEPALIRPYTRESGATGPLRLTGGQRRRRVVSLPEMAPLTPTWVPHVTSKRAFSFTFPVSSDRSHRSDICVRTGQGARPIVRFGATSASVLHICQNVRQSADHVTPRHIFPWLTCCGCVPCADRWRQTAFIPTPAPYFYTLYNECQGDFKVRWARCMKYEVI